MTLERGFTNERHEEKPMLTPPSTANMVPVTNLAAREQTLAPGTGQIGVSRPGKLKVISGFLGMPPGSVQLALRSDCL